MKPSKNKIGIFCTLNDPAQATMSMLESEAVWLKEAGIYEETFEYLVRYRGAAPNCLPVDKVDPSYISYRELEVAFYKDRAISVQAPKLGAILCFELTETATLLQLLAINGPFTVEDILRSGSVEKQFVTQAGLIGAISAELEKRKAFPQLRSIAKRLLERISRYMMVTGNPEHLDINEGRLKEKYDSIQIVSDFSGGWVVTTELGSKQLGVGPTINNALQEALTAGYSE